MDRWLVLAGYLIALVILAVAAISTAPAHAGCNAPGITDRHDWTFERAARRKFPLRLKEEWCVLKAVCWIESRLDPQARSHAGAEGLCQVMPSTGADLRRRGLWRGRLRDAKANAEASAAVLALNWKFWAVPRSDECRLELALASYNAGPGNIERAQRLAGGALCWEGIRTALPEVTGRHARETINYVSRFWAAYRRLRGYGL